MCFHAFIITWVLGASIGTLSTLCTSNHYMLSLIEISVCKARRGKHKTISIEENKINGGRLGMDSHVDMSCMGAHASILEVCEGQQYDVEFEHQQNVELEQYIKMISYKTAVLIAAALKMGAIIANASEKELTSDLSKSNFLFIK